jgi:hypothetical protein
MTVALPSLLVLSLVPAFQDPSRPPKRPPHPDPSKPRERVANLVKLPEDFVQFARLPEGGVCPRLGVGKSDLGVLYLGRGGELFLARTSDGGSSFSQPLRLNAEAVATPDGGHRGSVDIGPDGSAHVAWIANTEPPALRYTRVPSGATEATALDLGAPIGLCSTVAVTVEDTGQVLVFYAAAESAEDPGKRIWMRRSADGATFSEPVAIDRPDTSVSGACGMAAHVDEVMGTIFLLYRAAYPAKPDAVSLFRGMRLISSEDHGDEFDSAWVDNWKSVKDPRSIASLSQEANTTLAVWDSGGHVYWSLIRRQLNKANLPMEPRIEGPPVLCLAPSGAAGGHEVCMAWLERPEGDPQAPTRLAWRVWQREGHIPLGGGYAPEAPGAATPAVLARQGGGFTILF